jgi:hypothetical protein
MPPEVGGLPVRVATSAADLAAVTKTISRAFHDDPTWSWAFPDPNRRQEQYAAERYGFVKIGEFFPPSSDVPVTTMWRDGR